MRMKQTAGKFLPIATMQVLDNVETAIIQMGKIMAERANDIARTMRAVVDDYVKLAAMGQDRLSSFFRTGVGNNDGNIRVPAWDIAVFSKWKRYFL